MIRIKIIHGKTRIGEKQMKLSIRIFLLFMGAILMAGLSGCADNFKYERFTSRNPNFKLTTDYVSGWEPVMQAGSWGSFLQAVFYEPEIIGKVSKAYMAFTQRDSDKVDFSPVTLQGLEDDLLKKRSAHKDMVVVKRSKTMLSGAAAVNLELTYRALVNELSTTPIMPVRERIVILKKGDKFYTLRYMNLTDDFAEFDPAFHHCIKSIKFKN